MVVQSMRRHHTKISARFTEVAPEDLCKPREGLTQKRTVLGLVIMLTGDFTRAGVASHAKNCATIGLHFIKH